MLTAAVATDPRMSVAAAFGSEYRQLGQFASGDTSDLFLAERMGIAGFQKRVVLKRLRADAAAHPHLVQEVLDEARLVAELSHRNVAQVLDVGEDLQGTYIAMEYVAGGSLAALLERTGALEPAHAVEIARQIAEGLAHAHTARTAAGVPLQIVHRSVTPKNALLDLYGTVKLVGFGQARSALRRQLTAHGCFHGDLLYYSPERCRGAALDPRSDQFSLGIVLCNLLGSHPYWRGNLTASVLAIQSEPPRLPSRDRPELSFLDPVLGRLLALQPEERFASAADAADALEAVREGAPVPSQRLAALAREVFGAEVAGHVGPRHVERSGLHEERSGLHEEPTELICIPTVRLLVEEPLPVQEPAPVEAEEEDEPFPLPPLVVAPVAVEPSVALDEGPGEERLEVPVSTMQPARRSRLPTLAMGILALVAGVITGLALCLGPDSFPVRVREVPAPAVTGGSHR